MSLKTNCLSFINQINENSKIVKVEQLNVFALFDYWFAYLTSRHYQYFDEMYKNLVNLFFCESKRVCKHDYNCQIRFQRLQFRISQTYTGVTADSTVSENWHYYPNDAKNHRSC